MARRSGTEHIARWPDVGTEADLFNVAGSPNSDPDVEAGDLGFVTGVGLFQCDDATVGAAVWSMILAGEWTMHASLWALNPGTIVSSYNIASLFNWGTGDSEAFYGTPVPAGYNVFAIATPIWSGIPAIAQIQPPNSASTGVITRDLAGLAIDSAYNLFVYIARI